jgi:hypothetical protein
MDLGQVLHLEPFTHHDATSASIHARLECREVALVHFSAINLCVEPEPHLAIGSFQGVCSEVLVVRIQVQKV